MSKIKINQKEVKSKSFQVFQSNKFILNDQFLPYSRKQRLLTKNPFVMKKVRPLPYVHERKQKELNAFMIMKKAKAQHPSQVQMIDLSGLNLTTVNDEHLKYFINLHEADFSMNQLNMNDFIYFTNLKYLNLTGNIMKQISLSLNDNVLQRLQSLNLSYNNINPEEYQKLQHLKSLKELNIEANELECLPQSLVSLQNLEKLNLSNNKLNSNMNAGENWEILASLQNLKVLNISRNQLRGIHTEKLKAGDFFLLEFIDISYNKVDNQYNLICCRNFQNLRLIDITGNPFAMANQYQGFEMEVVARTGAQIINNIIEKNYLRKTKQQNNKQVKFGNLVKLQENYVKKGDKTYFFGVNLIDMKQNKQQINQECQQDQKEIEVKEQDNVQIQQQDEEEVDNDKFFLTEDVDQTNKRKQQKQSQLLSIQELQQEKRMIHQEVKQFEGLLNKDYNSFKQMTAQMMGNQKNYDDPIELVSSYRILQQMLRKPNLIELNDSKQKNYQKSTISTSKYQMDENQTNSDIIQSKQQNKGAYDLNLVQQILDNLNQKIKAEVG